MKTSLRPLLAHFPNVQCVLFDLDGTLADTARDLAEAALTMRRVRGLDEMDWMTLRPFASMGARGLLMAGLNIKKEAPEFEAAKDEFLRNYENHMMVHTRLFDGASHLLDLLDQQQIRWGVVSNKVERYVRPICEALGIANRACCLIGGDTTGFAKPHPRPILVGMESANATAQQTIYLGDDHRDILAAKAAGTSSVACAYGYSGDESPPTDWGAELVIDSLNELFDKQ